jgi:predicted DNA-binding WGR domain protein
MKNDINGAEIWDKLTQGNSCFLVKKHSEQRKKDRYFFVQFGRIAGAAIIINVSNSLTLEKALMSDTGIYYSIVNEKKYEYIEKAIQGIVRSLKNKLSSGFEFISKEKMIESLLNINHSQYLNENKQVNRIIYMRDKDNPDNKNYIRLTIYKHTIYIERSFDGGYNFTQGVFKNTKLINKIIDRFMAIDYMIVEEDLSHTINDRRDRFAVLENTKIQNYLRFRKRIESTKLDTFIIANLNFFGSYNFIIHEGDLHKTGNYDLSNAEVLLITGDFIVDGVLNLCADSSLLVLGNVNADSLINSWNCPIYIEQNLYVKNSTFLGEYPKKVKIGPMSNTQDMIINDVNKNPFDISCKNIYSPFEEPRYFYKKYYIEKNGMSYFSFTELLNSLKNGERFLVRSKFNIANKKREQIKIIEVDKKSQQIQKIIPNSIAFFHEQYEKYAGFSKIPYGVTLEILGSKYSFDPNCDIAVRDNRCKSGIYLLPHEDGPRCLKANKKPDTSYIIDALTLITRYFNLSNYMNGYYNHIHDLKTIEEVNQAYNFEKSSLQDDKYLANYWLFHFALITDPRFAEVKATIQHCSIEEELEFIRNNNWNDPECIDFKQRQAVLILNTYMNTGHFMELQNAYQFAALEMKLVAIYWMAEAMNKNGWLDFNDQFNRSGNACEAYLDAMNPLNTEKNRSHAALLIIQELIDNEKAYKKLNQVPKNILLNVYQLLKETPLLANCYMLYLSKYSNDEAYHKISTAIDVSSDNIIELLNQSIAEKKPVKQVFDLDADQQRLFFIYCIENLSTFNNELLLMDILWSHSEDKITLVTELIAKLKYNLNPSHFLRAQQDRVPFCNIPGNNLELIKNLINIKNKTGIKEKYFLDIKACFYQLLSLLPVDDVMYKFLHDQLNDNISEYEKNIVIRLLGSLKFSKTNSYAIFENILSLYKKSRYPSEKYQLSELYKNSKNPYLVPWLKSNLLLNWFYEAPETIANQWGGLFYKIYSGFEERVSEIDTESFSCKEELDKYYGQREQYVDDLIWLIFHTENDTETLADAIGYPFRNEYDSHQEIVEKLLKKINVDFTTHAAFTLNSILPDKSCYILHKIIWQNRAQFKQDIYFRKLLFDGIRIALLLHKYVGLDEIFQYAIQDMSKSNAIEKSRFFGSRLGYYFDDELSYEYQLLKEGYLANNPNLVCLEYRDKTTYKYYKFLLKGKTLSTCYAKVGGKQRTHTKEYKTEITAKKEFDIKIAKKINESYSPILIK